MRIILALAFFINSIISSSLHASAASVENVSEKKITHSKRKDAQGKYLSQQDSRQFKFSTLSCAEGNPDNFTIAYLKSSLIPKSTRNKTIPKDSPELLPIKDFLSKALLTDLEKGSQSKFSLTCTKKYAQDDLICYVAVLSKKKALSYAEQFSFELKGEETKKDRSSSYYASAVFFPFSEESKEAFVFLLGKWRGLNNKYAVVPEWGLRFGAHKKNFSGNVKKISGKNDSSTNPTSRTEKKQRLDDFSNFTLEVGTEGVKNLQFLPRYALKTRCMRLCEASDTYQLHLPQLEEATTEDTLFALGEMATYCHRLCTSTKASIHRTMRGYLDTEIRDKDLIAGLNSTLEEILQSTESSGIIFPHDSVWQSYGKGALFQYKKSDFDKSLIKTILGKKVRLNSEIVIRRARIKDIAGTEPLGNIIYTLPIEHEGKFYRFVAGQWFQVSSSRFKAISHKLRDDGIKVTIDALVPFSIDDARAAGGKYAEDAYNRRVVSEWNSATRPRESYAILLDQLNIHLKGAYDKFEFADIVLFDNESSIYLIHVKRRTSGDIDHHRTQVERCADYLATELASENAGLDLLFDGFIRGIYLRHKVDALKQNRGDFFTKNSQSQSKKNASSLSAMLLDSDSDEDKDIETFKTLLKSFDLSFFDTYKKQLPLLIDALYDCHKKITFTKRQIQALLDEAQKTIEFTKQFFKQLKDQKGRRKIRIVMAVIDDRQVIKEILENVSQEKNSHPSRLKETELFHYQDLWGLDRTCQHVTEKGFTFNLAVVNENHERRFWDAFGEYEASESESDSSSSESEKSEKPLAKRRKLPQKPSPEDSSSSSSEESPLEEDSYEESSSDENLRRRLKRYNYSAVDVNKLIYNNLRQNFDGNGDYEYYSYNGEELIDGDEGGTVVHRLGTKYVLPAITSIRDDHTHKEPEDVCIEVLEAFYSSAEHTPAHITEILIPFNPGGHWVTLRIKFLPAGALRPMTLTCIESLGSVSTCNYPKISAYFRRLKGYKEVFMWDLQHAYIQSDSTSCGPITANNLLQLIRGERLPNRERLTESEGIQLKIDHQNYLVSKGHSLDFDA